MGLLVALVRLAILWSGGRECKGRLILVLVPAAPCRSQIFLAELLIQRRTCDEGGRRWRRIEALAQSL